MEGVEVFVGGLCVCGDKTLVSHDTKGLQQL